jgi:hypothetical protein
MCFFSPPVKSFPFSPFHFELNLSKWWARFLFSTGDLYFFCPP